jgi:acyl-CoA synthetase (NDP forming)
MLNIQSEEQAEQAYDEITQKITGKFPDADIRGIQVSRQIQNGMEVILGIKKDASFGSVVMFGFGGIFVEIFRDVSFRVAPVDKNNALKMIREIKSSELLLGARGIVLRDMDAIADSIVKLSTIATGCPQIKELDINPLIVLEKGKGCFVADAKIILENYQQI